MNPFDPDGLKECIAELNEEMADPELWGNPEKASAKNKELKVAQGKLLGLEKLDQSAQDIETLIELTQEMDDASLVSEIDQELIALETHAQEMHLATLLTGKYDTNNAILTLHAGAGGTEAQDWTSMLYRMYKRYCEQHGYKVTELDFLDGDEAGIKSVTMKVEGINVYGFLKSEKGVHRLVRISPFDSASRRHTSFSALEVMPEIQDDTEIKIPAEELRVETHRSTGAGGQHINKTDSAIRITHIPTGIVVQCQSERSQIQNRETAMSMLRSKLIELKEREREQLDLELKGDIKKIEWGSQIRSYVFHPYNMVKDHRTGEETSNIQAVMDGDLDPFIHSFLSKTE